ncbi:IS30 family transposase [Rubritalea squalenifaciens]|uniref:IS30 family transposase n=1 Tax=Rubritalea squalenifaciens TaxID=407226 RepID=UPI0013562ED4|nr:IS30 family transposase [Rubritalea squalenifaciens]
MSFYYALKKFKTRTITYDNGTEFSNFREVASATGSKPFFCNPYHAWEKGLVENTIGLIREYFPKKTGNHLPIAPEIYQQVQEEINQRPRKTMGFRTPDSFIKHLAG